MIMENEDRTTHFRFPIRIMQGVLSGKTDKQQFLRDALYYHLYAHTIYLEQTAEYEENRLTKYKRLAEDMSQVTIANPNLAFDRGAELYEKYFKSKVFVSIRRATYWEFRNNFDAKTDFDFDCLFAFLALKSIIGRKKYVKTDNALMLARMSGKETKKEYEVMKPLPFTRYYFDKIKMDLQLNWNLKYYSRNRGFYCGFDITLQELVFVSESKKKSNREKLLMQEKKEAVKLALERLKIQH